MQKKFWGSNKKNSLDASARIQHSRMQKDIKTPYGTIAEDDIRALEYRLDWYFKYANQPYSERRNTDVAKADYGLQYERYVGYLFESHGFSVKYNGACSGLNDGGLDLIARAPRKIRLIQCKRWRHPIGLDAISRLVGATERFIWEERRGKSQNCRISIRGVIATTSTLEKDAEELCKAQGIFVMKQLPFMRYPSIKAQRITDSAGRFLLPFTPRYDRITLNFNHGDCFIDTVREAISKCFFYPQYHVDILRKIKDNKKNIREAQQKILHGCV